MEKSLSMRVSACSETSRIYNAITYKTLILNYNSKFNLGIFLFFFLIFTYSNYDFSNLILYIFNLKKLLGPIFNHYYRIQWKDFSFFWFFFIKDYFLIIGKYLGLN